MGLSVKFGGQTHVAKFMMRIASDKNVNGKQKSSEQRYRDGQILTHAGCSFIITPRSTALEGFMDSDREITVRVETVHT